MKTNSKITFYRRLLIATLIDSGIGTVPRLVEITGMGRRTVQEVLNTLSDIGISCLRTGSTKSGYYFISDWGFLGKNKIKKELQHINDVLECSIDKQQILDFTVGIPMSEQRLMQALFNQQRIQIMSLGVDQEKFSDDYLFAWEAGVYPFFSDTDGSVTPMPHECYPEFFKVKKEVVDKVTKYLDDKWLDKKVPTFYELEEEFGGKWGEEDGRMALIGICRYAFLRGSFNSEFWDTLLTPMEHPSEASSIRRKLDRERDIYFN